jgi:hypothetical protein
MLLLERDETQTQKVLSEDQEKRGIKIGVVALARKVLCIIVGGSSP